MGLAAAVAAGIAASAQAAEATEPTTTTTVESEPEPSPEPERAAWLDDEAIVALGMVVAFSGGACAGRALWGAAA